jgi:hypothetical protein
MEKWHMAQEFQYLVQYLSTQLINYIAIYTLQMSGKAVVKPKIV